jgi:transcriptional regulator with XRE-family HTH domain
MFAEELRSTVQAATWELGIEQAELARRAALSESAISRFLRGERFLSPEAIDRVLAVLGMEVVIRPRREREGE